ncbi:MAG: PhzF family phenazine biosynthesis protein [Granulosicoccus sp.]|jgi:PhzF family phenazine biosynthesis protein
MKKTQTIYQVDAFTEKIFGGNPAAVCPLENWLPDDLMQSIAMENNLAETAFYVSKENHFELRWFTPTTEVDLCGHATLASAHVIFSTGYTEEEIIFISPRSGELRVRRKEDLYTMNFPTDILEKVAAPSELVEGLGISPLKVFKGKTDFMVIVENQAIIESLQPNFKLLEKLDARGTIITAPGQNSDFVSRCFFPQAGVDEDPTTGSAHTSMIPYWANQLGKTEMTAIQLSNRKGHLKCKYLNDRVEISGFAKTYLIGEIFI